MKLRADLLLFQKGLCDSRAKAQALILAGQVFFSKGRVEKAGQLIDEAESLEVREGPPFVSRGGLKLNHALNEFRIDVTGKVCLDVGASTGGFTDCLLQRGAKKVYAVDVGYGQFHAKLRKEPRVVLFEKSNFRYFDVSKISEPIGRGVYCSRKAPVRVEFQRGEKRSRSLGDPSRKGGREDSPRGRADWV